MKPEFRIMVLTPRGLDDAAIAVAGSRAGAVGILDLGCLVDVETARAAVNQLVRLGSGEIGLRIESTCDQAVAAELISLLPATSGWLVIAPGPGDAPVTVPRDVVSAARERGLVLCIEVSSVEDAESMLSAEVAALIAKGSEAGGRTDEETTFVLLQELLHRFDLPVWARGGIGLHTAAACAAAGAAGVVLADELALIRESTLPADVRAAVAAMDGGETVAVGAELGRSFRFFPRPANAGAELLKQRYLELLAAKDHVGWVTFLGDESTRNDGAIGWRSDQAWPLGQDASFAASLAARFRTTGSVVTGLLASVQDHLRIARSTAPLAPDAALARTHGTRYPVVQGPMTRVSDVAPFAAEVAKAGGLPFIALALLRADEAEVILSDTAKLLGDQPWGVGILGFVPLELREEQLAVVRRIHPKFALIAGGRPDQARALESDGIACYLHVPSPRLLGQYLDQGARRFVFEGRECGGHVGPRSSFVLWNQMVSLLAETASPGVLDECHVLFAGGIHDARSAAMVAALAAPLAAGGAKIGVLMGTAYLATEEAVSSGAILPGFQAVAVGCTRTTLLETGPGHATRCAMTPFADRFLAEKARLLGEGRSKDEVRLTLEALNLGKLRVASKGLDRNPEARDGEAAPKLVDIGPERQASEGMYMIGQAAALVDRVVTMAELHHGVSAGATDWLSEASTVQPADAEPPDPPLAVAIVGMSCLLPGATDLQTFWDNILNGVDTTTEVPPERWDWRRYFDGDRAARDKVYSRWGGFLPEIPFDPLSYGIPPTTLRSIEPLQLLTLEVVRAALADAGLMDRDFPRQRASIILGAGGGVADLGNGYAVRAALPALFDNLPAEACDRLPEWTEDSFAGLLLNVAAGRAANRFDLGGINLTVDAACASSLGAIYFAAQELADGRSDLVLAGGVDTVQNPFGYLCFSKTQALSPSGRSRVFDAEADGIVISEGLAVVVLKRLADAERDGDRIYAVLQGVGGSSDGRGRSMTAPRPQGQMRAVERAYRQAGYSPASVELFEAHGTGTAAGDVAEAETLTGVLEAAGAGPSSAAVGSVKSMIGHTKCAAGVTGVIKTALALQRKVLPPTLNVTRPNPKARFGDGPLYVNSELRPWLRGSRDQPRRAGVSAFGFGGTNFHVTLEEYTGDLPSLPQPATAGAWPGELLLFRGDKREVIAGIEAIAADLERGAAPRLRDLAVSCWNAARSAPPGLTAALVATDSATLAARLSALRDAIAADRELTDPEGAWYTPEPLAGAGRVALLFPGQGSQYPDMFRDLCVHFRVVREEIECAERALAPVLDVPLGAYLYPPPAFTAEERQLRADALRHTRVAQPALGAVERAGFRLLADLGVAPDMVAGHSYGEYAALAAAGVLSSEELALVSEARGRWIVEAASRDLGTMAAVSADGDATAAALAGIDELWVANYNAPLQTVISGTDAAIGEALDRLRGRGIEARTIPVSCGFHSPLVSAARDRLAEILESVPIAAPQLPVYSNSTAGPYPDEVPAVRELLSDHLVTPVRFADEVTAMYQAGARLFLEVGPKTVLTGLVGQILDGRPHLALPLDRPGRSGLVQLLHVLGALAAHGVPVNLDPLFSGRDARQLVLDRLLEETAHTPLPPSTWMVSGGGVRPLNEKSVRRAPFALPTPSPASAAADGAAPRLDGATPATPLPGAVTEPLPSPLQALSSPDVERVICEFQGSMKHLIESQERIMLAYLGSAVPASNSLGEALPQATITADFTADAGPLLEEPIAARPVLDEVPTPPIAAGRAAAPPPAEAEHEPPSEADIRARLVAIVVDRTGYPAELVDAEASLEADLGIDSIKRVEILGELQRSLPGGMERHLQGIMEALTTAPTLDDISRRIARAVAAGDDPAEPPRATGPEPSVPAVPAADELCARLLAIVVERTGYPAEMVDPEASLEADLGIDSIKRVEILGELQRSLPDGLEQRLQGIMEDLTSAPSLVEIAVRVAAALGSAPPTAADRAEKAPTAPVALPDAPPRTGTAADLPRFRMTAIPIDPPDGGALPDGTVIVTDDGRGTATALVSALRLRGTRAELVDCSDLGPDSGAAALIEALAATDDLVGVVHLAALTPTPSSPELSLTQWRQRLRYETGGFFHLARLALPALGERASENGRPRLMAATILGGDFALGEHGDDEAFPPGHGGICGLAKTLAVEQPMLGVKVVDLDIRESVDDLAGHLLTELLADDGEVEVGWREGQRLTPRPVAAPADGDRSPVLGPESVVLLTGGARGITAEIAVELAEQFRSTLILVGRSPEPAPEDAATAEISDERQLKSALIDQRRKHGLPARVTDVEADFRRVIADREIRATFESLAAAGSSFEYHTADVRDPKDVARVLGAVHARHGRLDAVVHGAGCIEDKLLVDKDWDSFERVFETKALSAYLLGKELTAFLGTLRFVAFFSSVAGAFPNRGQADYTAGNEVMNKLAVALAREWSGSPCRVVALNWGPWEKGMANAGVQKQFRARGIEPIPVPDGRSALVRELVSDDPNPVIVLGRGPWQSPPAPRDRRQHEPSGERQPEALPLPAPAPDRPLMAGGSHRSAPAGFSVERILDPSIDLYLDDHRLDGRPVLPMAAALEMMAELAELGWPALSVVGVRELSVLKGIVLPEGNGHFKMVRLDARPLENGDDSGLAVHVEVRDAEEPKLLHYRATVDLATPSVGAADRHQAAAVRDPFPMPVAEAYRKFLFHGHRFAHIEHIDGSTDSGLLARIRPSDPSGCVAGGSGSWLIDPIVFDSGLQLVILWARTVHDVTPLPSRFTRYRRYGPLCTKNGGWVHCELRARAEADARVVRADLIFFEEDGRLLGVLEGLECSASRELNRLASRPPRSAAGGS